MTNSCDSAEHDREERRFEFSLDNPWAPRPTAALDLPLRTRMSPVIISLIGGMGAFCGLALALGLFPERFGDPPLDGPVESALWIGGFALALAGLARWWWVLPAFVIDGDGLEILGRFGRRKRRVAWQDVLWLNLSRPSSGVDPGTTVASFNESLALWTRDGTKIELSRFTELPYSRARDAVLGQLVPRMAASAALQLEAGQPVRFPATPWLERKRWWQRPPRRWIEVSTEGIHAHTHCGATQRIEWSTLKGWDRRSNGAATVHGSAPGGPEVTIIIEDDIANNAVLLALLPEWGAHHGVFGLDPAVQVHGLRQRLKTHRAFAMLVIIMGVGVGLWLRPHLVGALDMARLARRAHVKLLADGVRLDAVVTGVKPRPDGTSEPPYEVSYRYSVEASPFSGEALTCGVPPSIDDTVEVLVSTSRPGGFSLLVHGIGAPNGAKCIVDLVTRAFAVIGCLLAVLVAVFVVGERRLRRRLASVGRVG